MLRIVSISMALLGLPAMVGVAAAQTGGPALDRLFDARLNATQRNDACFELRGGRDAGTIAAMTRALEDDALRICAAANLRAAGEAGPFAAALASQNPQTRAVAARELGWLHRSEDIAALVRTATDENLLVASNAVFALSQYPGKTAAEALSGLARRGGMTGDQALNRLLQVAPAEAAAAARTLMASADVGDRLYAIRALGEAGNGTDLPALRKIREAETENLSSRSRGFGLMPAISLSKAAAMAMERIEARRAGE